MKIYIRLYLIVVGLVLIACEKAKLTTEIVNQDTIIIGTGNVPGEFLSPTAGDGIASDPGPLACLTIVKFYNPELLNNGTLYLKQLGNLKVQLGAEAEMEYGRILLQ